MKTMIKTLALSALIGGSSMASVAYACDTCAAHKDGAKKECAEGCKKKCCAKKKCAEDCDKECCAEKKKAE